MLMKFYLVSLFCTLDSRRQLKKLVSEDFGGCICM